ncbi:hypothetical protein V6N12_025775 [Hibiscus sabdariffa]|uniref:BED-type domain-containing protein n=1 Tax=Hibiscus sabdariffa TaxID=183260 RepID=A0ABR2AVG6_9ROSI
MASTVDSDDVYLSDVDNSPECHVCSASGHMRASVSSGQDKWIVDSGATHHTTPDASKVVNGTDYNGPGKSDESLLKAGQQGSSCKHELSVVRGAHKVCTDFVMSPTTTSFTMNGRDQYEGQLSAGGQNNEGRQEDVANIGGINVEIQPDATEEDPVDYVDPEIPCAESGVEVTVEHDVQSGDESICGDGLLSGGGDEAIADVPEISVTNLPATAHSLKFNIPQTINDILNLNPQFLQSLDLSLNAIISGLHPQPVRRYSAASLSLSLSLSDFCPKIMSMTGENSDDLMKLSSSDESPKEPEEVAETPTNAKNKRKGKKVVEATSGRGKRKKKSVVWDHFKEIEGDAYHAECVYCSQMISCASSNGTNAMKRHTSRCKKAPFNVDSKQTILDFESKTKCNADGTIETELRKIGGAPDDEDWDKIASFLPFLQMFYEATLSFSGSRYVTGNTFVEEVYDIGYTINRSVDDLNDGVKNWIRASHDPIMIEESLLALENMEEEMQDLTLEQPTIIIDETSEVPELFL